MRSAESKKKKIIMKGARPSPLMVKKERQKGEVREPIIIYTQSPKIIHTKPQDFMALVQRLTGNNGNVTADDDVSIANQIRDAAADLQYSPSTLSGFADVPLFTPSSPFGIFGNLISPSAFDFINQLPHY